MPFSRWMKLLKNARPYSVDELLYEIVCRDALDLPDVNVAVSRHAAGQPTGFDWLDRRLSRGVCYLVTIDRVPAHWSWLLAGVRLPGQCGFDRSAPVIGDCFTPPQFRGRGLYPQVLRYIARDVALHGDARRVYVLVDPQNRESIRGIEKAGYRRLARLRGTRLLGQLISRSVEV